MRPPISEAVPVLPLKRLCFDFLCLTITQSAHPPKVDGRPLPFSKLLCVIISWACFACRHRAPQLFRRSEARVTRTYDAYLSCPCTKIQIVIAMSWPCVSLQLVTALSWPLYLNTVSDYSALSLNINQYNYCMITLSWPCTSAQWIVTISDYTVLPHVHQYNYWLQCPVPVHQYN